MAFEAFTFVLLIFLSLVCHTAFALSTTSGYGFIKLQGSRKGEKVQGISELKHYLERFGYLNYESTSLANSDDFDEQLELAIKKYQIFFRLPPTGILDFETASQMMLPRCGNPDFYIPISKLRKVSPTNIQYVIIVIIPMLVIIGIMTKIVMFPIKGVNKRLRVPLLG
ncbi:Metalloendoproteinase 5-MMP [Euphorbia peplus]|nr:Metalloendoproteinase 5-MMP [Euphorbia peplus]